MVAAGAGATIPAWSLIGGVYADAVTGLGTDLADRTATDIVWRYFG